MLTRCAWPTNDAEMIAYHDLEWGTPVHDDRRHFEFLILESAQAGLSWKTVLHRRDGYRRAFADYDPHAVARFTDQDAERLVADPGIIRNRAKIKAAIGNARAFLAIAEEFGSFDAFIWSFVNGKTIHNAWKSIKDMPAKTHEAEQLSAALVARGCKFAGPTIMYAHMQACGLVNDHTVDCYRYRELVAATRGN